MCAFVVPSTHNYLIYFLAEYRHLWFAGRDFLFSSPSYGIFPFSRHELKFCVSSNTSGWRALLTDTTFTLKVKNLKFSRTGSVVVAILNFISTSLWSPPSVTGEQQISNQSTSLLINLLLFHRKSSYMSMYERNENGLSAYLNLSLVPDSKEDLSAYTCTGGVDQIILYVVSRNRIIYSTPVSFYTLQVGVGVSCVGLRRDQSPFLWSHCLWLRTRIYLSMISVRKFKLKYQDFQRCRRWHRSLLIQRGQWVLLGLSCQLCDKISAVFLHKMIKDKRVHISATA